MQKLLALAALCCIPMLAQAPAGPIISGGGTGAPNAISTPLGGSSTTIDITHTFTPTVAAKSIIQCYTSAEVLITAGFTRSFPNSTTIRATFGSAQAAGSYCTANATGTGATGPTGPAGPAVPGTGLVEVNGGVAGLATPDVDFTTPAALATAIATREAPLTFSAPFSRAVNTVSMPAATSSANGYLASSDWIVFNAKENALTFSAPFTRSTNTISIPVATSGQNGYLSSADWVTFNAKQSALGFTPANVANNGSDFTNAALLRTNIGLAIGTNVQAFSSTLLTLAGKTLLGTGNIRFSSGAFATNDCVKVDANGDFVTAGAACGSGSGGEANTTADVGAGTFSWRGSTPKSGTALNLRTFSVTAPFAATVSTDLVTFSMPAAATAQSGYLSSTDWNTFNGKYGAGANAAFGSMTVTATGAGTVVVGRTHASTVATNPFFGVQNSSNVWLGGLLGNGSYNNPSLLSGAAVFDSSGTLAKATGSGSDCLKVDGSSGPCGTGGSGSTSPAYTVALTGSLQTILSSTHNVAGPARVSFYAFNSVRSRWEQWMAAADVDPTDTTPDVYLPAFTADATYTQARAVIGSLTSGSAAAYTVDLTGSLQTILAATHNVTGPARVFFYYFNSVRSRWEQWTAPADVDPTNTTPDVYLPAFTADATYTQAKAVISSLNTSAASSGGSGVIASQAEAEAGTENTKTMSALRTAQAITAQAAPIAKGVTNGDTHDHNGGDGAQISHLNLSNIGTNSHAAIDTALGTAATHQANTSNPHSVTKAQVGLSNVDNTSDATKNAASATLQNKNLDNTNQLTGYTDVAAIAAPAAPSAGKVRLYAKTSVNQICSKDSTGAELCLSGGGGHTQNTDTGTTATSFQIDSGGTGPRWKNVSGAMTARNAADSAYADVVGLSFSTPSGTAFLATGGTSATPSTPSTGNGSIYLDSTTKTLKVVDDAGALSTTVRGSASRTANQFCTHVTTAGVCSTAAIVAADVPDISATYAVTAKGVTNGDSHDHNGGDGAQIAHSSLSGIGTNSHASIDSILASLPSVYAPIAKGVTNGDSHDHNGGDGAAIAPAAVTAPLKTRIQSMTIFDPVAGDSGRVQFMLPSASTITRVACSVKAATSVTINLDERAAATPDTSGTAVLTSALVCDTDEQASTTFTNAGIAARVPVALTISAVSGTPDTLRVFVEYSID